MCSSFLQFMCINTCFQGCIPPLQRTMLEILPLLCPSEHLSSMWSFFLQSILKYLPRAPLASNHNEDAKQAWNSDSTQAVENLGKKESPNVLTSTSIRSTEESLESGITTISNSISGIQFSERLIPVLIDLFLRAPDYEKYILYPEVIQALGRCMTTRRDSPDGSVWRLAVEGFNRILVTDVGRLSQKGESSPCVNRTSRSRIWKEAADVFELFLVGYCGRALHSNVLSTVALEADIKLDMEFLTILGDTILKSPIDAPTDILQRLVSTLDRCASRTCSLPVETVGLLPSHCFKFSLACLKKLFILTSFENEAENWNPTRSEVSKIAIMVLMERCEHIVNKFLIDEANLGERPFPAARLEEVVFLLQELAHLTIHPDAASVLPLHPHLKHVIGNHDTRAHLLVLHPSLCELIISREPRVRELVQVLLKLICEILGLQKLTLSVKF